jgi:hypothetical protein
VERSGFALVTVVAVANVAVVVVDLSLDFCEHFAPLFFVVLCTVDVRAASLLALQSVVVDTFVAASIGVLAIVAVRAFFDQPFQDVLECCPDNTELVCELVTVLAFEVDRVAMA